MAGKSIGMTLAASLWLFVCLAAAGGALRRRVVAGMSIRELFQGGLDEIPALKWLLQTTYAAAVLSLLITALITLASGGVRGEVIGGSRIPAWAACISLAMVAIIAGLPLLGWMLRPARKVTALKTGSVEIGREVSEGAFREIGGLCRGDASTRWERVLSRASVAALVSYMIAYLVVATKPGVDLWPASMRAAIDMLGAYSSAVVSGVVLAPQGALIGIMVPAITLFVIVGCGSAAGVAPVSSRVTLQCGLGMTIAIISAALDSGGHVSDLPSPGVLGAAIVVTCLVVIGLRRAIEFLRVGKARQEDERRATISETFSDRDPDLQAIARSNVLEPLRREEVLARIEHGLEDQERRNRLVPRLLARLMQITDVRTTRYATIQLRFLVVRRRVVLERPKPSRERHRHPRIDVWDEAAYPIVPPQGYAAAPDHRAALPPDLDVVKSCGRCGGSGSVWEQESYTDWENYTDHEGHLQLQSVTRWRSVLRTCNECAGTGSVRFRQVILTSWRTHGPVARSSPSVSSWSMLDETPERELLVRPLLEQFRPASAHDAAIPVPESVAVRLRRIADVAVAARHQHAIEAGRWFAGRVYRSEIAIGASNAVRLVFEGLPGGVAWILGADGRCLFQRVPLSRSAIVAVAVIPPFALWAVMSGCGLVGSLLHCLLTG